MQSGQNAIALLANLAFFQKKRPYFDPKNLSFYDVESVPAQLGQYSIR